MQNLSILIKMNVHNLLRISGLNDLFRKNELKRTPIKRQSILDLTFVWGDRETEDRAKVSMPPLFRGTVDQ